MEITLKTLTPLWTGGADQTTDRLHETGLIGSLRWWYEAIVRGLGGYACDPTSEDKQARCEFDTKAYERVKKEGKSDDEAIYAGLHNVCPVCYLFGTTGWARLFHLRAIEVPMTPLHFRATTKMNQNWLERIFGGENQNIDSLQVPYGHLKFGFNPRQPDADYVKSQFALILRLSAEYGGIGARLQHGFGQFKYPTTLNDITLEKGLQDLQEKLQKRVLRYNGKVTDTPYNLRNFVSLAYEIPKTKLVAFTTAQAHIGKTDKKSEHRYIPCAFDLRYKGTDKFGMRQWLKSKGWRETTNPKRLEEIDILLGPRSQWGKGSDQRQIDDDFRTASRVFFGMPFLKPDSQDIYILRVWAFWLSELISRLASPKELKTLLEEYIQHVFGTQASKVFEAIGENILEQTSRGTK